MIPDAHVFRSEAFPHERLDRFESEEDFALSDGGSHPYLPRSPPFPRHVRGAVASGLSELLSSVTLEEDGLTTSRPTPSFLFLKSVSRGSSPAPTLCCFAAVISELLPLPPRAMLLDFPLHPQKLEVGPLFSPSLRPLSLQVPELCGFAKGDDTPWRASAG